MKYSEHRNVDPLHCWEHDRSKG